MQQTNPTTVIPLFKLNAKYTYQMSLEMLAETQCQATIL